MDDFCKTKPDDRGPYFEVAANNAALSYQIIEKDFWVCWTLRRLFRLQEIGEHLVFKGGTSLSKAFSVIERFSEDIDVSVNREYLGFVGNKDPEERGISRKKREERIEQLADSCKTFVQGKLKAELERSIQPLLGKDGWSLTVDPDDGDGQTLLFFYPLTQKSKEGYIPPRVKIEMGARSDHWPAGDQSLQPYLAEHVPNSVKDPKTEVKVLDAARTFWEKATILHSLANIRPDKQLGVRQSRHYYDLYRLALSRHKSAALKNMELLKRVAEHKRVYFAAAWAKYEEAKPGTLKLIPKDETLEALKRDYAQMKEMFFKEPPKWDEIITALKALEREINSVS